MPPAGRSVSREPGPAGGWVAGPWSAWCLSAQVGRLVKAYCVSASSGPATGAEAVWGGETVLGWSVLARLPGTQGASGGQGSRPVSAGGSGEGFSSRGLAVSWEA